MIAPVPACPAVVSSVDVVEGGLYDVALTVQICNRVRKFGVVLEGHNKFCVGRSNFGGEGSVCFSEGRNRSAITSRSSGKVGDGAHRFLLVNVISQLIFLLVEVIIQLESGTGSSDLLSASFLVSSREECFKGRPCFACGWQALPGFSVIEEEASLKD